MPHVLIDNLNEVWFAADWRDTTVVIAVSGGADSVALLRALEIIARQTPGRGQLIAAHFNHRLRGSESDEDAAFVANLCRSLKIPLHTNPVPDLPAPLIAGDVLKTESKDPSLAFDPDLWDGEDQSRQLRYGFLRQVVTQCGARYLVMAHHADDQVETVLHRILRGTGIQGLAGIPGTRELLLGVSLIRPLLNVWRTEILDFLAELQQPYRDDSSNASSRFTRNRLRHELLPLIERDFNPRGKEALFRLATIARDVGAVLRQLVEQLFASSVRRHSQLEVHVDCRTLGAAEPYLIRELLADVWQQQQWPMREMSQEKWNQLVEMAMASTKDKKIVLPGRIVAARIESLLILREEVPLSGAEPSEKGE